MNIPSIKGLSVKGSPLAVKCHLMAPVVADPCWGELAALSGEAACRPRFDFPSLFVIPKTIGTFALGPDEVVKILRREQTVLLGSLLDATTEEEFVATRNEVARQYWLLSESIRNAVSARFSAANWTQLAKASVREIIRAVERHGPERIGADGVEEAVFSISTLGKLPRLLLKVMDHVKTSESVPDLKRHSELFADFIACTLVCELHLHLLMLMLKDSSRHIRPFALTQTLHGIRSAVLMYAALREVASLVESRDGTLEEELATDDDDCLLLEASARDAGHTLRNA
jgi:hypothetical protein